MTVFCSSYQMMSQEFSKIQDNFFTVIFTYCINFRIVGEVLLLKSKRAEFWVNGLIPRFLYRQGILYESIGIDLAMHGIIEKIHRVLIFIYIF